ncbi:DJ-1/PfpI family protein [Aquimarina macrocephali]|uniref:DJ-1/PfpI family protein n=1 Tax=Aquimarina macrocephali TaxID=666563 RepID=UPI000683D929|nr:DJ-1/PfpI family protein [Aquimarina macrocephali]
MQKLLVLLLLINISAISQPSATSNEIYVCPPCNSSCDTLKFSKPGICHHCNMKLTTEKELQKLANKKMTIAFYLQPGIEVLDFAGPMEVFAYANFEVFTVSKTKEPIISQGILKILPDYSIVDSPNADILAFFGGNSSNAFNDPQVIEWIKAQQNIEYHFSVCTGVFALAKAGVLDGKSATTFHNALNGLETNYPNITVIKDARFVDNGQVITTAGISAGIDGALHLVAKLQGFNEARRIAYHMEYDKWVPGEGVILSEDDPYKNYSDRTILEAYTGTYEYLDGAKVKLKINPREKALYAIVDDRNYPIFHVQNNTFMNLANHKITFIKDKNKKVTGYTSSQHPKTIFHKLSD